MAGAEVFVRLIGEAGCPCSVYRPLRRHTAESETQIEHIADWVAGLAKPVGVLACYDFRGQQVLDAGRAVAFPGARRRGRARRGQRRPAVRALRPALVERDPESLPLATRRPRCWTA